VASDDEHFTTSKQGGMTETWDVEVGEAMCLDFAIAESGLGSGTILPGTRGRGGDEGSHESGDGEEGRSVVHVADGFAGQR